MWLVRVSDSPQTPRQNLQLEVAEFDLTQTLLRQRSLNRLLTEEHQLSVGPESPGPRKQRG